MPTKAIIFDCFGVLVTDGWYPFLHKYFHDKPEQKNIAKSNNKLVDSGLKSYQDHISKLSEMTGESIDDVLIQIENNVSNKELFAYIESRLKVDYKIGMLSNAGENWLDRLFEPKELNILDEVILSCDIGITKPDKRAYEKAALKLGVLPEECIFIDDVPLYCSAAEDLGMKAINYKNTEQTISQLEELL